MGKYSKELKTTLEGVISANPGMSKTAICNVLKIKTTTYDLILSLDSWVKVGTADKIEQRITEAKQEGVLK